MIVSFSLANTFKHTLTFLIFSLVSSFLFTNPVIAQNDDKFDCPRETWPPSLIKARDDLHKAIKKMPDVTVQLNGTQVTLKRSFFIDSKEPTQEALKTLKEGLVPCWGVMSTFPAIDENFRVHLMAPLVLPLEGCSIKDLAHAPASCTITAETPLMQFGDRKLGITFVTVGKYHMSSSEGTASFLITSKNVLLKDPRLRTKMELFIFEARKLKAASSKLKKADEDFLQKIQAFKEKLRTMRQQRKGQ